MGAACHGQPLQMKESPGMDPGRGATGVAEQQAQQPKVAIAKAVVRGFSVTGQGLCGNQQALGRQCPQSTEIFGKQISGMVTTGRQGRLGG
jgi:hypothetical protein